MSETLYRIDYSIKRQREGEDGYTEIGFGSTPGCADVGAALYQADSDIRNYQWETGAGMPDPQEIRAEDEDRS